MKNRFFSKSEKQKNSLLFFPVVFFFLAGLFFQTDYSEKIMMVINGSREFWDKYLDLLFYSFFAIVFLCVCYQTILADIKAMKPDYLINMVIAIVFIIVTMVISAIILKNFGIGKSANEELLSESISKNRMVMMVSVVLAGPFVEEIVFRHYIYNLLRGNKKRITGCITSVVVTSLLFALYHCDIKYFIECDYRQLLSVIPLFFMGTGLAYLKETTSNIICPVIVHVIINIISIS